MSDTGTHTIDPSSTSPGAILKRCREYHDITLQEAEETTKIGANYLQALEEDQISQFGSQAYLKGFLRIYATYLGLNPDDMIRLFDKLYASGPASPDNQTTGTISEETRRTKKRFPLQKLILPVVILTLILATSAFINRSNNTSQRAVPPSATTAPSAAPVQQPYSSAPRQSPAPARIEPAALPTSAQEPAPVVPVKSAAPADSAKGFIIRLKVIQSGTLTVTIDGAASQGYELVVGDVIEWKANRGITLELSNAGGVEAELNGKPLKPFGPAGKSTVVMLDADGVKP